MKIVVIGGRFGGLPIPSTRMQGDTRSRNEDRY
jgi:hypothetical protein